jgi:hypothetical protein
MFDKSTLSESIIPKQPTPALAKNSAAGHPRPPIPIINTFYCIIFFWPKKPTFLRIICLENLSI